LIISLAFAGIVCALFFFLMKPGLENLVTLGSEVTKAEDKQQEYSKVIAEGRGASEQIAEAIASYDEAKKRLFTQMLSEALDSTVTGYLVKAGFEPQSLSLSTLSPETVDPFVPTMLNPDQQLVESTEEPATEEPAAGEEATEEPATEEPAAESAEGDAAGEGGATGVLIRNGSPFLIAYAAEDDAETDEAAADETTLPGEEPEAGAAPASGEAPAEEPETGGSLYSYTVNVTVGGDVKNFYKLLDIIAGVDGMEILQYSLPAEAEEVAKNTGDEENDEDSDKKDSEDSEDSGEEEEGSMSFSFAIKLYVFLEEDVQYVAPEAEATTDTTEENADTTENAENAA
jgi:hypothetical protein